MIDETIYFKNTVAKVFAFFKNAVFENLHIASGEFGKDWLSQVDYTRLFAHCTARCLNGVGQIVLESPPELDFEMDVFLASNSPRRRQLMTLTGLEFQVFPADVDETPLDGEPAHEYVQRLAASKARAVGAQVDPRTLVIAADTTVVDGNQILGKPVDNEDARRMLQQLRGRSHQVFTAIALLKEDDLLVECCGSAMAVKTW